jgi:hypothetical protein
MGRNKKSMHCSNPNCGCKTYWYKESEHVYNEETDELTFESVWRCGNCGDTVPFRSVNRNYENRKPNPMQQRSIDHLRRVISRDFDEARGETFTKFEVTPTGYDYGFWVSAEVEMTGLGKNNVLRILSEEHWHVYIGPRGKIDAHSYPRSLEQFKGGEFLGINIK